MSHPDRDAERIPLGADTAGAVDLATCRAAGMTDERTAWLVESGRWQSVSPRVFSVFSGPVPLRTMHHAALLYAGEGAVLSHESAGCHWRSPRRTRIERTVLDLLADRRTADAALGLVADAVSGRSTTATLLRAALIERPRTRWRKVILEALPDVRAGAHSALEIRDAALRRRHGLPMGVRQARRLSDGSEYLDVLIEEWRLHIELDGRLGHDRAREAWRDMRRDNRSEVLGLRHLRYGWADMFDRSCQVAAEQAVILRQQGWRGTFAPCRACPHRTNRG